MLECSHNWVLQTDNVLLETREVTIVSEPGEYPITFVVDREPSSEEISTINESLVCLWCAAETNDYEELMIEYSD